ncbi:MAG TPA: hypothetical protein VGE45_16170 [Chloroflexia bacterium]|jgi:hypothetical protein
MISDEVYNWLEREAGKRGLESVEHLLEVWRRERRAAPDNEEGELTEEELQRRLDLVRRIDELRERIYAKYGYLGDSTEMIREDRER